MISAEDLIEEKTVLCGSSALSFAGLVMFNTTHYIIQTRIDLLNNSVLYFFTLKFNPKIDYEYRVVPSKSNPMLLLPTKERALVENIQHLEWVDEGLLVEGLKNYIAQFWNEEEIYKVADHFGLDHSTLEYWLEEARNDYDD